MNNTQISPQEMLRQITLKINEFLDNCNSAKTPVLCQMAATEEGRKVAASSMIDIIISEKTTIAGAAQELERIYNINRVND